MKIGSLNASWENIMPREGLDPFDLTLVGMSIVFVGLVVISTSVYYLPQLIAFIDKCSEMMKALKSPKKVVITAEDIKAKEEREKQELAQEELNIMMAIAVAINLEDRLRSQKITWVRHEGIDSSWKISGRVTQLSNRSSMRRL